MFPPVMVSSISATFAASCSQVRGLRFGVSLAASRSSSAPTRTPHLTPESLCCISKSSLDARPLRIVDVAGAQPNLEFHGLGVRGNRRRSSD
jgi:hypothetical protein